MAIERTKIVDAALDLLDEVGIDSLTTRRLADRLGVQQPALYWHFSSKRALLDAMNEEILRRHHIYGEPQRGDDWKLFLYRFGQSFRDALLSHRDGARVYSGAPPTETQMGDMEARLLGFAEWGFPVLLAMQTILTVNAFVLGSVLDEQADAENQLGWERTTGNAPVPVPATLQSGLAALREGGRQAVFDAGLRMIIEGIAPMLEGAAGRPSPKEKKRTAP